MSDLYKLAVTQQLEQFVADTEQWADEFMHDAQGLDKLSTDDERAHRLRCLTSALFGHLQSLAWLSERLTKLAAAAGKDPAVFANIGMGEDE